VHKEAVEVHEEQDSDGNYGRKDEGTPHHMHTLYLLRRA
jgi:hypothetical protein